MVDSTNTTLREFFGWDMFGVNKLSLMACARNTGYAKLIFRITFVVIGQHKAFHSITSTLSVRTFDLIPRNRKF